jgi:hypothetical protein
VQSNYADEDDADVDDEDDEFGADYDEGLSIDDFGNVWEGMLEKQVREYREWRASLLSFVALLKSIHETYLTFCSTLMILAVASSQVLYLSG